MAALQACVGKLSVPRDLKVIDFLDEHAQRWIATSPFLFAAFGNGMGVAHTAAGGKAGFVRVPDPRHLRLPVTLLDVPTSRGPGGGVRLAVPNSEPMRDAAASTVVSCRRIRT